MCWCHVVVAYAFKPNTREAEASRVWDQADLQIKFKDNQGNWETMSWKKIFFKVFIIFLKKPIYIATQLHGSQERTL